MAFHNDRVEIVQGDSRAATLFDVCHAKALSLSCEAAGTRGRPSRFMHADNLCNPATGRLSTARKSSRRGKTALEPHPAFSFSALMQLYVRRGAHEIEHGPHDDRVTVRIDIDAELKPHTVLFDSRGEFMTGEAIRWCARYSINLLLSGGPGRLITMVESALETKAKTMTRMRDVDPSIVRAQCAADPVKIAREIVRAKIHAELNAIILEAAARRREFEEWDIKLNSARSVAEIMIVEGRAAASYWRTFRDAGLRERKNGNAIRRTAIRWVPAYGTTSARKPRGPLLEKRRFARRAGRDNLRSSRVGGYNAVAHLGAE
jgi:hypothetical protein